MAGPLVYYFDQKLEKRCPVNELGGVVLDWGETKPGTKKEKLLYVKNNTPDNLTLRQPYTEDSDLKITDFPPRLKHEESGKVKLEFAPKKERLDSLKAPWGFDVIIG